MGRGARARVVARAARRRVRQQLARRARARVAARAAAAAGRGRARARRAAHAAAGRRRRRAAAAARALHRRLARYQTCPDNTEYTKFNLLFRGRHSPRHLGEILNKYEQTISYIIAICMHCRNCNCLNIILNLRAPTE